MSLLPTLLSALALLLPAAAAAQDSLLQASPTRGQVRLAAQDALRAAGVDCDVTDAVLLGADGEGGVLYEAVCAHGPGQVVFSGTSRRSYDCVALAGMAERTGGGRTCRIGPNRNVLPVIRAYAVEAGVECRVDRGMMLGHTPDGAQLYEIGCDGRDGWWIERADDRWATTPCMIVTVQGGACRYTTEAETRASVENWLGGVCRVDAARYMGRGDDGGWIEVKCADGRHDAVRFDAAMTPVETLPCGEAAGIGGGCVLGD